MHDLSNANVLLSIIYYIKIIYRQNIYVIIIEITCLNDFAILFVIYKQCQREHKTSYNIRTENDIKRKVRHGEPLPNVCRSPVSRLNKYIALDMDDTGPPK